MIPHRTIDLLGVDKAAASLQFKSHEAYVLTGMDLNDLCGLAARFAQCCHSGDELEREELREWTIRLDTLLREALASKLEG